MATKHERPVKLEGIDKRLERREGNLPGREFGHPLRHETFAHFLQFFDSSPATVH